MPTKLEHIHASTQLRGLVPNQIATVVSAQMTTPDALTVYYTLPNGQIQSAVLFRKSETALEIVSAEQAWDLDADGSLLRLVSEAYRIRLAHLFDPRLAVHISLVEPLPHQITAVYGEMLARQPLRYLLADDPGAGKTIMAGLLIKELLVRGDVRRCLICAPGSLAEQWQDELWTKFGLEFDILTRETVEASRTGNPYNEHNLAIIRLDQVSRSDELVEKLKAAEEWDLIVCDEAHKMAAYFDGNEVHTTRRYQLGRVLSKITRHFLLMTATPHNGHEEDFQLFMALLDPDRFEGKFREGTPTVDVSDIMRRMVKESLLKFDGTPLFPERRAYTISYQLSEPENHLYEAVSDYVRNEFNRADALTNDDRRKGTVGFALTVLQRRLASSPEAIYQSLVRRRERLEARLKETSTFIDNGGYASLDEWLEEIDDIPEAEQETTETQILDAATAAQTVAELKAEIATLRRLEVLALEVRRSDTDRKWEELRGLMDENEKMKEAAGRRHKLVIFTEHRATLDYLYRKISTLLGREDAVLVIHGGVGREDRRAAQEEFANNPAATVLLATDAAGEGINLQTAHLMVNYDLPWNPNRLEQRFGRIHRIGQREVCHLWNLVAGETREGSVYRRLLQKLETERNALGGQVFDVLGQVFNDAPLRRLLLDAIRYGDDPLIRAKLDTAIDNAVDRDRLRALIHQHSLVEEAMNAEQVAVIREDMERAAARRLQPHYVQSFFLEAFARLGGTVYQRENGRYQITHVPRPIRDRNHRISRAYERMCFDKRLIHVPDRPGAAFICPGHPLLDAVIAMTLEQFTDILNAGAVLIDPTDPGTEPRALFYLEQRLQDGSGRDVSKEVHFVEALATGAIRAAGSAPYLDYRPPDDDERAAIQTLLARSLLRVQTSQIMSYAVQHLLPEHLNRVQEYRTALIEKTLQEVHRRLNVEINYWDRRANELLAQERLGKPSDKLNSVVARRRADDLHARLRSRTEALQNSIELHGAPPLVIGRALVVPLGALLPEANRSEGLDRRITEQIAMRAVMNAEIALGHSPRDVSAAKLGYDIESREGSTGRLRFIEVKGRRAGADTLTLTRNEHLPFMNQPDAAILVIVEIDGGHATAPRYVRQPPLTRDPGFAVTTVDYNLDVLLANSTAPD